MSRRLWSWGRSGSIAGCIDAQGRRMVFRKLRRFSWKTNAENPWRRIPSPLDDAVWWIVRHENEWWVTARNSDYERGPFRTFNTAVMAAQLGGLTDGDDAEP